MRYLRVVPKLFALAIILALAVQASAQSNSATLAGTVSDQTGAVLSDVKILIVNVGKNVRRQVTTNKEGRFTITPLEPGTYTLRAQRQGFSTLEVPDIVLNTADRRELQIKLKVGKAADSITVEASSVGVETGGGVATVVGRKFVENTAVNGRSFQSLMLMTPGAVQSSDGYITFNGMRSDMNYFTVDGISANNGVGLRSPQDIIGSMGSRMNLDPRTVTGVLPNLNTFGGTQGMLGLDALEEFKVQTSAISAQYGRQMGAQIQLTSRSGTNAFHGSAFDYLRNDALNAAPTHPTSYSVVQKPKERQNNFGGTFGGPVIKDKTFFFFSYEGQRNVVPSPTNSMPVPSMALRNADPALLAEWLTAYQAAGKSTGVTSGAIMAADVKALLNMFPVPNVKCTLIPPPGAPTPQDPLDCVGRLYKSDYSGYVPIRTGYAYWQGNLATRRSMDNWSVKVDHNLSSRLSGFVRYNQTQSDGNSTQTVINQAVTEDWSRAVNTGINWLPSNTLSNSLSIGFSESSGGGTYGLGNIHDGGIAPGKNTILDSVVSGFNRGSVTFSNYTLQIGKAANSLNRQWNLVDNLTWTRGKHAFSFGFDWRYLFPHIDGYAQSGVQVGGYDLLDVWTDRIGSASMIVTDPETIRTHNYSLYAQDTWRVTSRLTVDMGVRWELNPPPSTVDPGSLRFVTGWQNPATMTLAPKGTKYYDMPWRTFAPRLGVSYGITNTPGWETVLRAGWGLFYDLTGAYALNATGGYPLARGLDILDTSFNPVISSLPGFLATRPAPIVEGAPYPDREVFFARMDSLTSLPKSYQWNLSIQQSLGSKQTLTASYVGNSGRNMARVVQYYENGLADQLDHSFDSPNFRWATINVARNDGNWGDTSDYNALQVAYQRRMGKGLDVLANWTWAHAIDTNSSSITPTSLFTSPEKERGNSDSDRRHIFNAAINYETPRLTSLGPVSGPAAAVAKYIINGWAVNTNLKAQTGQPMTPTVEREMSPWQPYTMKSVRVDYVPGQPVWISDPTAPSGRYINMKAFAPPASCLDQNNPLACTNGNSARNGIVGYGMWSADMSVRRFFPIRERMKLEFRADFYNVLNHPNWGNPKLSIGEITTDWDGSNFGFHSIVDTKSPNYKFTTPEMLAFAMKGGLISTYQQGGPRSIQLALKLTF